MKIDAAHQKELIQACDTLRSFIENLEQTKGCISCINWKQDKCGLYKAVPPQDIISNGCPSWEIWDEIPYM